MPASASAETRCCSQTRSGTHIPRTAAPNRSLQVGRVVADLPDAVAVGDHRQDRLVEPAAEDLDPPRLDQRPDPSDVLGLPLDQPLQQRARGVQDERDLGIALQHVQERQVAVAVGRLEDAVEVADGLVVVQGEDQADAGHGRSFGRTDRGSADYRPARPSAKCVRRSAAVDGSVGLRR